MPRFFSRRHGSAQLAKLERDLELHATHGALRQGIINERLAELEAEQADLRRHAQMIAATRDTE